MLSSSFRVRSSNSGILKSTKSCLLSARSDIRIHEIACARGSFEHEHDLRWPSVMKKSRGKPQHVVEPRRRKQPRWWAWQMSIASTTAISFLAGACLFLMGSIFRLFQDISSNRNATRIYVLTPYFIGSLFFTTGCMLPLPRVLSQYYRISKQEGRRRSRARNEREAEKVSFQTYLAKLELVGSAMAIVGGLMINTATSIDLYLGSKAELVFTIDTGSLWIITLPTMLGRALFILAGWFTWAARNHSWSIRNVHGGVYFWWTTILFWVGTALFYAGWFCTDCPSGLVPEWLVKNWCCIMGGYILGSLLLIMASYCMLLDLNRAAEIQGRQDSEAEAPLIIL